MDKVDELIVLVIVLTGSVIGFALCLIEGI